MKELLVRTISGIVLVAVIVACALISPWTWAALGLVIVGVGTYEMAQLQQIERKSHILIGELLAMATYVPAALLALGVLPLRGLLIDFLLPMMPLLWALFSKSCNFKSIAAFVYGSMAFLSMPMALLVFMHTLMEVGELSGARLILLVFALPWVDDIFAYLTGRLLGKHKLFERISPGKTIEGSLGGLVFTLAGMALLSHFTSWLPLWPAIGLGLVAVLFGTLGDLCESMLKRQAGVKDSGKLIPGHGGVLDRFDSVLFAVPFVFVFLLLL